jgi:ABC-2 type transport system ATP-binding protein
MDEAERLCDRIAVLDQGKVVAIDTAQGLKDRVSAELGGIDVTLEDVFIQLTGRALSEEVSDAEADIA